jgi:hypothetical protein
MASFANSPEKNANISRKNRLAVKVYRYGLAILVPFPVFSIAVIIPKKACRDIETYVFNLVMLIVIFGYLYIQWSKVEDDLTPRDDGLILGESQDG